MESKTLKLCSCNGTIPLDAKSLGAALKAKQPLIVHRELCRKEAGAFQSSLADPDLIVACTQEAPLFSELASAAQLGTAHSHGRLSMSAASAWAVTPRPESVTDPRWPEQPVTPLGRSSPRTAA